MRKQSIRTDEGIEKNWDKKKKKKKRKKKKEKKTKCVSAHPEARQTEREWNPRH
ncbi:hypothetical protein BP00DRAFT_421699 [Aspergillus indologenus CBS 114.80]|uniref:Uncharacterized protein n=1 Tax=Aspergillus indologenus CBS 114.80 TaxID=1450541 RepID=A0A2V5IJN3_9EURO|nr:hypothetical protein BP00DRAFT_421699 [Aspergillus indologenus CBS 114.80]